MARADRARDDIRRAEDRQRDSQLRQEDRERDDRLRREVADEWDRRTRAGQRAREDYEARQVTVELTKNLLQQILVSTPASYPIRQVSADIVHWPGSNLGILPIGQTASAPVAGAGRVWYTFPAAVPPSAQRPEIMIRFVDEHGNL